MKISEITINYKPLKQEIPATKINSSKDAVEFIRSIWSDRIQYIEEFHMILMNRNNKIMGYSKISEGGTAGTIVDAKVIFQAALKANAHGIILCHNHPSGNLNPSNEDISLTKKIKNAGALMDIQVFDHLILTGEGYYSFADEGIL